MALDNFERKDIQIVERPSLPPIDSRGIRDYCWLEKNTQITNDSIENTKKKLADLTDLQQKTYIYWHSFCHF